jgi:hypothetical protein|tara:strand:- start:1 stop:171 length:171 start_codon:yes stop_codon:yes gene_type:complete
MPLQIKISHDIRDLLLGWEKEKCPACESDLTFTEHAEGVPIEVSCEECHDDVIVTR